MASSIKPVGEVTGAKGILEEWFTQDLITNDTTKYRLHISITPPSTVEYTLDGGGTWNFVKLGVTLEDKSGHEFDVPIRTGDEFNLRSALAVTIQICRVDRIASES